MSWIAIRQEFESTEISLKDLAAKHSISEGTMRSRKNREKWQRNATQTRQRATEKNKNVATQQNVAGKLETSKAVTPTEVTIPESKSLGGRPTKYDEKYNNQAYKLCLLGATDKEIADFLQVDEATLNRWKIEHKEFRESLTRGKIGADANIAKSLYHRAKGYEHKETITATFQGKITDTMEVVKHYPPDTPAATLWLKNRQPKLWRDKQDIEMTGPNGGPLLISQLDTLSETDLRKMIEIMEKAQIQGEVIDIESSE